ncbi:major facilitator superfamily domain-containing protein [Crassisporium funariophilum]|nr:major facilitator superfamily domain-containing protein [Crassisporium funariophilum]
MASIAGAGSSKSSIEKELKPVAEKGSSDRQLANELRHINGESQESDSALTRHLLRKVDLRMSILVLIYVMNQIDRNNAAAARLAGFEEDLGLVGSQFPTILAVYLVGYIIMQVPSNMFLNHVQKPSIYLPGTMFVWGVISCLTGITQNFTGAALCRFFLGFVEAAFFPGALLLMSRWYKRDELGLRTSILFCGLLISIAFGNLIASGILANMHMVLGHASWRWLYFIEGAITCAIAIVAIFILPDFPENSSSWLTPEEQSLAMRRMREDAMSQVGEHNVSGKEGFKQAVKDWKVWWLTFTYGIIFVATSYVLYLPTLAATLGFNPTISLVLCAPPSMFGAVTAFFHARHSDRTQERYWHIALPFMVAIIGHIIVISTMNPAARYFGFFLVGQSPGGLICFVAWITNSFPESSAKRAVALGIISSVSQLGGIMGSFLYPVNWGPSYRISFVLNIVASALVVALCYFFRYHLSKLNQKAEEEERTRGQLEPGYRYLL